MNQSAGSEGASPAIVWRLAALGVLIPLTALSVGVDAGEIFQIFTIEDLEIDARLVGIALGLGTLSIPLQIAAARIPLRRARHNMRIFVASLGAMALLTAVIVAYAPPDSAAAKVVLAVAVVVEIAFSVLYATSWQPVIAYTLSVEQRQFQIGPVRAITGLTILGSVILFGQLDGGGRALFLAALGVSCLGLAWSLGILPPAPERAVRGSAPSGDDADSPARPVDERAIRTLYALAGLVGIASWPLLLTYIARVIWSAANLSIIGAALALGAVVSTALWRDPGPYLRPLLGLSTLVLIGCTVAIAIVDDPGSSTVVATLLLVAIVVGAAARSLLRTGILELTHRLVDDTTSVRVMTIFDAIGSTSHQLGFFIAGFLISASVDTSATVNAFQWFLLASAGVLCVVLAMIRSMPADREFARSAR